MKVNLYVVTPKENELRATVELEVVPNGVYIIDGVEYMTDRRPTFHINKLYTPLPQDRTHSLVEVDLFLIPFEKKQQ